MIYEFFLLACASLIVFDAFRRKGSLARPEFYMLFGVYLYETLGYLHYMISPVRLDYMVQATQEDLNASYGLSLAAMAAIYVGGRLYRAQEPSLIQDKPDRFLVYTSIVGALCAIAYALYLAYISGAFQPGFLHRDYFAARATIIFLPFGALFTVCVVFLACNEKRPWSLLFWVAFMLTIALIGSRRLSLYSLFALFVAKQYRGFVPNKVLVVGACVCILIAGLSFGALRGGRSLDRIKLHHLVHNAQEFSRNFTSNIHYYQTSPPLLWGGSILDAFLIPMPRFIQPWEQPQKLSHQFKETLKTVGNYSINHRGPAGSGLSFVADAMANFGPWGVVPWFLCLSAFARYSRILFTKLKLHALIPLACVGSFACARGGTQDVIIAMHVDLTIVAVVLTTAALLRAALEPHSAKQRKGLDA